MQWETLEWKKNKDYQEWNGMKIRSAEATVALDLPDAIGVDPGINFGLGIFKDEKLTVYWGKFPKQDGDYRYSLLVSNFVHDWVSEYASSITRIAIEGPSFGSHFKQVVLEDVRVGFWLGFKEIGKEAIYVPPATVRKVVFGGGRIKASDLWLTINGNAADAGAVCLYAAGYKYV